MFLLCASHFQASEKTSHRLKVFAKDISDRDLLFKIYKDVLKVNSKKTNNPMKKWAKSLNRYFTKKIQIANKHIKRD